MRYLTVVEHEHVFQLARIAHHAVVADDDVLAQVGVVTDLAVAPNDRRAFDHRAVLDHRAHADEDLFADVSCAFAAIFQCRSHVCLQIIFDFLERLPGVFAVVEQGRVFRLAQVEQIRRFEHGVNLGEGGLVENDYFTANGHE